MSSKTQQVSQQSVRAPKTVCLDEIWAELRDGVEQVYAHKPMSKSRYMRLYTHLYDCCNVRSEDNVESLPTKTDEVGSAVCLELYERLRKFLGNHVATLAKTATGVNDEDILAYYAKHWEQFKSSTKVMSGIFMYLNRIWVRPLLDDGRKDVYDTYELAMLLWKDGFLKVLQRQLTRAVLNVIDEGRKGASIDTGLLRAVIFSYVELGVNEDDPSARRPNLSLYKDAFESEFLKNTECFYNRQSAEFLEQHNVTEYAKMAMERLAEEQRRAQLCFHASTLAPLTDACVRALVQNRLDDLCIAFKGLLNDHKVDDLRHVFELVSFKPCGLRMLRSCFEAHIEEYGLSAVESLVEETEQNSELYINTLIAVISKFKELALTAFPSDASFADSVDKGCVKFINKNAVTRLAKSSKKSAELLAKYFDTLLRRVKYGGESETELYLNQAMLVFNYIDDKDTFFEFYTKQLGLRLLQQSTTGELAESSMASKLKLACSSDYSWRLQRMFKDLSVSKEVSEEFRQHVERTGGPLRLEFAVRVLTSAAWPLEQRCALHLPRELERSVERFTTFYRGRHCDRKLQWLHDMSYGDLSATCFKNTYTLQASTFQMTVLLQYNAALSLSVEELRERTGMEVGILHQVLQSLLKCRLLVLVEDQAAGPSLRTTGQIRPDSRLSLSDNYSSKRLRVTINAPLKMNAKVEQESSYKKVDEDRRLVTQAAIVRIMKVRGTLSFEELVVEVERLLSCRFAPTAADIQYSVLALVRRQYLEEVNDKPATYHYIA